MQRHQATGTASHKQSTKFDRNSHRPFKRHVPCFLTIGDLYYSHIHCQSAVQTPFLLTSPCQQYDLVAPPIIDPTWTCGLRSSGNFTCPAGESTACYHHIKARSGVFCFALSFTDELTVMSSYSETPKKWPPMEASVSS